MDTLPPPDMHDEGGAESGSETVRSASVRWQWRPKWCPGLAGREWWWAMKGCNDISYALVWLKLVCSAAKGL